MPPPVASGKPRSPTLVDTPQTTPLTEPRLPLRRPRSALKKKNHSFMRSVRRATHRKYTPEEKNPIGVEGFHREITVNDLCRREGINPANYYSWTKEFMEAGKERLTRKTVLDATRHEN
jgi:transposase